MKNEIKKTNNITCNSIPNSNTLYTSIKDQKLELLANGDYYIGYNEKQDIPIWNYLLSEDKTKIFIYDENDETIYDDLVKDAPEELFLHGECFKKVSFAGLNLEENIVSRNNFYLFKKQLTNGKEAFN